MPLVITRCRTERFQSKLTLLHQKTFTTRPVPPQNPFFLNLDALPKQSVVQLRDNGAPESGERSPKTQNPVGDRCTSMEHVSSPAAEKSNTLETNTSVCARADEPRKPSRQRPVLRSLKVRKRASQM